MSRINCDCQGCTHSNFLPILQRLKNCKCCICKRKNMFPFLYYTCVEIHFLYHSGYKSIKKTREKIENIKKSYKRNKKVVLYYFYFRYILLKILIEIQYRPGGSGYFKCMENYYRIAEERKFKKA